MRRLGSGGWSGVAGVRCGVGRDVIGFEEFEVRRFGSGRSKELGGSGRGGQRSWRVEVEGVWVKGSS